MKNFVNSYNKKASSSHSVDKRVWKLLGKVDAAPKVISFIRKAILNVLPVMSNLSSKRVVSSSLCNLCGEGEESVEHCLFQCEWARCVWFGSDMSYYVDKRRITTFDDWWLKVMTEVVVMRGDNREFATRVAYLCWQIWKHRCEVMYGGGKLLIENIIQGASSLAEEWLQRKKKGEIVVAKEGEKQDKWKAPDEGTLKINCDGSFKLPSREGGYRVIVRDYKGVLIDGCSGVAMVNSALGAEAAALKAGMVLAIQKHFTSVVFETDSIELVEALQDDTRVPWHVSSEIEELNALRFPFPSWEFSYISRKLNMAADWVARAERMKKISSDWIQVQPIELFRRLEGDKLSDFPD